jgi:cell division initiation protein
MEAALNEHREREKDLRATLVTAQRIADDIKAQADQEAKRVVREAETRSELLLEKTQARLDDVQREIDGLRLKRKDVETTVEAIVQSLRNTIEYIHAQDAHEREDRILLHRPRHTETAETDQADWRRRQNVP